MSSLGYKKKIYIYMSPNFEKPDILHKMLFGFIYHFRVVTVILLILSFVDYHEEQSLRYSVDTYLKSVRAVVAKL